MPVAVRRSEPPRYGESQRRYASRPAWSAFSFAAWNSGRFHQFANYHPSSAGPSLRSSDDRERWPPSRSLSRPSSKIARLRCAWSSDQLQPLGERRSDVCHRGAFPGRCEGERPLGLELDLIQSFALLGREARQDCRFRLPVEGVAASPETWPCPSPRGEPCWNLLVRFRVRDRRLLRLLSVGHLQLVLHGVSCSAGSQKVHRARVDAEIRDIKPRRLLASSPCAREEPRAALMPMP